MPDLFGFKIIPRELFFDRQKVIDAVGKGNVRALSKAGAFVWRRMRSITGRKSRSISDPGQPPKRHTGDLHDKIFFALAPSGRAVDIGPVAYKKGEAPSLLEFGGTATRTDARGRKYTARYSPHPFAGPSLKAEIEAGTIGSSWADVMGG